jgi:nucleoside diphosphate kinase
MSEETLIILKPDCMTAGICGAVISRFEAEGFEIAAAKVKQLDDALLKRTLCTCCRSSIFSPKLSPL